MIARNGQPTTKFIVTVDAETYETNGVLPPFCSNLYAPLPEGEFGTPKVMEICDRHGVKASFFVDVLMYRRYGEQPVRDFCRRIHQAGHDVQLHVHTSWLPDHVNGLLHEQTYERQVEIIAEGKQFIEAAIGRPPVGFRAGSYSANLDTLRALEVNGFTVDSSYFAHYPVCPLSRQLGNLHWNSVFKMGGVFEIPVTSFWLLNTPFYHRICKVDINACSYSELSEIVQRLLRQKLRYIVLFLHSFSFIRWNRLHTTFAPNYRALRRFERLMAMLCEGQHPAAFSTIEEAATQLAANADGGLDCLPTIGPGGLLHHLILRIRE